MATATLTRPTKPIISADLPVAAQAMPLTFGTRGDTSNPEPTYWHHEIGAATMVNGQRVINCWRIWRGGFEIVHRFDTADPHQVYMAAAWAAPRPHTSRLCIWKESRFPIRHEDEVLRVFDR